MAHLTEADVDIEKELMSLPRERALKIIADVLLSMSSPKQRFAIAAPLQRAFPNDPAWVNLIGLRAPNVYGDNDRVGELDEGCDFGTCASCKIDIRSMYKSALCPLCGKPVFLT